MTISRLCRRPLKGHNRLIEELSSRAERGICSSLGKAKLQIPRLSSPSAADGSE